MAPAPGGGGARCRRLRRRRRRHLRRGCGRAPHVFQEAVSYESNKKMWGLDEFQRTVFAMHARPPIQSSTLLASLCDPSSRRRRLTADSAI